MAARSTQTAAAAAPRWLSDDEQQAWIAVAHLVLQLPGALDAQLQRESGSNAAEVVDRVAETIRERFELRRLIKTLTVQGRMSRWIVSALPVVILLLLQLINPHYMHPLVASLGGKIVLGFAAALCVGGSLVIKKIVDIKV